MYYVRVSALCLCFLLFILFSSVRHSEAGKCTKYTQQAYQSKYKTKCGTFGWKRCTRYRTRYRAVTICCTDYSGSDCSTAKCINGWNNCPNGGSCQSPYNCVNCNPGYYSPHCAKCTVINDCEETRCTNNNNQHCIRCRYNRGVAKGVPKRAYTMENSGGKNNRICMQRCSWRSDSNTCFPGRCPSKSSSNCPTCLGVPRDCQCAPGFGTPTNKCRTISTKPTITHCLAKLIETKNDNRIDRKCDSLVASSPVYTNYKIDKVQVNWNGYFHGPNATAWPKPYFVNDFKVGVISGGISYKVERAGTFISSRSTSCTSVYNRNNPNAGVMSCNETLSVSVTWQHQDRITIFSNFVNGGYLKLNNYDSPSLITVTGPIYYTGSKIEHQTYFKFDLRAPVHCSETSSCSNKMLDISPAFTNKGFTIRWGGWLDADSGIKSYTYQVYPLAVYGNKLSYRTQSTIQSGSRSSPFSFPTITPQSAGVYAAILIVSDIAGNHQVARRFVMYDNHTKVNLVPSQPQWVASANSATGFLWQNNLQDSNMQGPKVLIKWPGHFKNHYHIQHKLLNNIEGHEPPLDNKYQQVTGGPPSVRSMAAIPNVNAIVNFQVAYGIDKRGGRSLTSPGSWRGVPTWKNEQVALDIPRNDGESVRIWVKGTDVMGRYATDSTLVHIDSSPPEIQNLWLTRYGEKILAVHHSKDLFDINFEFITFDDHSGLKEIHWLLHDKQNRSKIHGKGQITVRKPSSVKPDCPAPMCTCIAKDNECYFRNYSLKPDMNKMDDPYGQHEYDYFFVLTVTNNALLKTTKTLQITIDESPPSAGVVLDSPPGQTDIDHQQDLQVHCSWAGFFDRESGVAFYRVHVGTKCAVQSSFEASSNTTVTKTTDTFTSWTAPGPGKYFCSVVAVNPALSVSRVLCSDGVLIDKSAPTISQILVKNVFVNPGIAREENGSVWFIDKHLQRQIVNDTSESCLSTAGVFENLALIPERKEKQTIVGDCEDLKKFEYIGFLNTENMLDIEWKAEDKESAIYSCEVAIGSSQSVSEDILPFTSSRGNSHFLSYHAGLVQDAKFYIHVKAINLAQMSTIKTVGPFIVDITAPSVTGNINMEIVAHEGNKFLRGTWPISTFVEFDQKNVLSYELSLGTQTGRADVMSFHKRRFENSPLCPKSSSVNCVALRLSDIPWHLHGAVEYYLNVKATNLLGLSATASSNALSHNSLLPVPGVVIETTPFSASTQNFNDIDLQTSATDLYVRWSSFHHSDVSYSIKLKNNKDPQTSIATGSASSPVSQYHFTNLQLNQYETYFIEVTATSDGGSVTAKSDGVTILPVNGLLMASKVNDGYCRNNPVTVPLIEHHASAIDTKCFEDIDFQISKTTVGASFNISSDVYSYVSEIQWAVEEKTQKDWKTVKPFENVRMGENVISSNMALKAGVQYRSVAKFCFPGGCFQPVTSDGFWVIDEPPALVKISNMAYNENTSKLSFTLSDTRSPGLPKEVASIDRYEWTIRTESNADSYGHFWKWARIVDMNDRRAVTITAPTKLHFSRCLNLFLRVYDKVGFYTDSSAYVRPCDVKNIVPNIVIDAVGEWDETENDVKNITLITNEKWTQADKDYSRSRSTMSAVWPTLRHGNFFWKILSAANIQAAPASNNNHLTYHSYSCTAPQVIACGETMDNFVNAKASSLDHGNRYYVCLLAPATTLVFEKFNQSLAEYSGCSDGVTVDHTPPKRGTVWIGWQEQFYQASKEELVIRWAGFTDVEEHGHGPYHSGIRKYQYAIGTTPYGVDIIDFTDVIPSNYVIRRGLTLVDGHSYYATVKALDYAGHEMVSTSNPVTIDTSPPDITDREITLAGKYITSTAKISSSWTGTFVDKTSGISHYDWCVGSSPFLCDVMTFTRVTKESADSDSLKLVEGHRYYVTVRAENGAGLSSLASSLSHTVDATHPVPGHVYETTNQKKSDIDYQVKTDELFVSWEGFHDPHTPITKYTVNVGTCCNCEDVLEVSNIGVRTEIHLTDISLIPGIKYHTRVEACNAASLCISSCSDGVIVDTTPPVGGIVHDGTGYEDMDFQFERYVISARWYNSHDAQSGISHYTWRAGTSPGADDILSAKEVHGKESASFKLPNQLPVNKHIYITVRAYNHAGYHVESISDGFKLDISAPTFSQPLSLLPKGSIYQNTLVWRTALGVQWTVTDPESPVALQHITITASHLTEHRLPAVKIPGSFHSYMFSQLSLEDGTKYQVHLVSCNAAKLCTSSHTSDILVDTSPPQTGAFAVATEHAAMLLRHQSGLMTYEQSATPVIKLAWLGFTDPHSEVTKYHITVGTMYDRDDLGKNGIEEVIHIKGTHYKDEGPVQTGTVILVRNLVAAEQIYVSIRAENKVGLKSAALHGLLRVVLSSATSGVLELVRRCPTSSCKGHCTCAPGHSKCQTSSCSDVKGNSAYAQYLVRDILDIRSKQSNVNDEDHSPSQCTLAANWYVRSTGGAAYRFEWSAGVKGSAAGTGLINALHGRVWFDAGSETSAVMNIGPEYSMTQNVDYVFYVRAWYDSKIFATFSSNGIRIDSIPPEVSKSRSVEELRNRSHDVDVDYVLASDHVIISWRDVFRDAQSGMAEYFVSLSTHPGGEDIKAFTKYAGSTTQAEVQGLQLQEGVHYFSNVMAYNKAGLFTLVSSDGFTVDLTSPSPGDVWDGDSLHDVQYQSSDKTVSASWHGFADSGSYLDHYIWCVGTTKGLDDVRPCSDVGLVSSINEQVQTPLQPGITYYSTVYAVDAAGLKSKPSTSNGFKIDVTPPTAATQINYGTNVLANPSFESGSSPTNWIVKGTSSVRLGDDKIQPRDGKQYLEVTGEISQSAWTIPNKKYRLIVYSALIPSTDNTGNMHEATIHVPGTSETFLIEHRKLSLPGNVDAKLEWKKHVLYFTTEGQKSEVKIQTDSAGGSVCLDNLQLQIVDVSTSIDSEEGSVHVDIDIKETVSTIRAHWHFVDDDSPVRKYLWALGTVQGGTQLQGFKSTDMRTFGVNDDVILPHGAYIHVTVIAENAANLRSVVHSKPVFVDRTPPKLCCLKFDEIKDNVAYQSSKTVKVYWKVSDAETAVTECQWAIGLAPGSSGIQGFQNTGSLSSASRDLSNSLSHGQTIFVTIRCKNTRQLESSLTSSGLMIITSPPITKNAYVKILTPSVTHYASRRQHQSQRNEIAIGWSGINDNSGIEYYEVSIAGTSGTNAAWKRIANTGQEFAVLRGLDLTEYNTYAVMLRAVNKAGLFSEVVSQNVTVETSNPQCIDPQINSAWPDKWTLNVTWNDVFSTNSSLIYEVSIGLNYGGSDVLLWKETEDTSMKITGVDSKKEHFVTVTAVSSAGLYNTKTFVVSFI